MRRGFTLVELSIVLVIIGLLIGGILVAKSMVATAKIQATIRQIGQFDAAVENFHTVYNTLPGDNLYIGNAGNDVNVNVNGIIGWDSSVWGELILYEYEVGSFWYDLAQTGLKKEDGVTYTNLYG